MMMRMLRTYELIQPTAENMVHVPLSINPSRFNVNVLVTFPWEQYPEVPDTMEKFSDCGYLYNDQKCTPCSKMFFKFDAESDIRKNTTKIG